MIIIYDFRLIILSVLISMLAAHACLLIFSRHRNIGLSYKIKIVLGAFILGGGIWTMHFIGMLALHMPMPVNYAVLPTLISVLIAIILTALGLYAVSSGHLNKSALPVGAILMGGGISSMHYIGMEALVAVCQISYKPQGIIISTLLGIIASGLSLKLAFSGPKRKRNKFTAAIILGLAISSLHYTAMYYTQFSLFDSVVTHSSPALSTTYLACIVAVTTFFVVNIFLLINLPDSKIVSLAPASQSPDIENLDESTISLIVTTKGVSQYVSIDKILFVKADRHYTKIGYINSSKEFVQKLCNDNISKVAEKLKDYDFLRCHRSFLINLSFVSKFSRQKESGKAILKHNDAPEIPVSRSAYSQFIKEMDRLNHAS